MSAAYETYIMLVKAVFKGERNDFKQRSLSDLKKQMVFLLKQKIFNVTMLNLMLL